MNKILYQFYYFVPKSHLEKTKTAIFKAGAGNIGGYSCCSWQTKGIGQFKPSAQNKPYLGKTGKISKVIEYRVETICSKNKIKAIIAALKKDHPYEYPAFGFIKLDSI